MLISGATVSYVILLVYSLVIILWNAVTSAKSTRVLLAANCNVFTAMFYILLNDKYHLLQLKELYFTSEL